MKRKPLSVRIYFPMVYLIMGLMSVYKELIQFNTRKTKNKTKNKNRQTKNNGKKMGKGTE